MGEARSRFGGSNVYLFDEFGAVDIMYAPVVTRFRTYAITLPDDAAAYCAAIEAHPWMQAWMAGAHAEPWVIDKYERLPTPTNDADAL